jgi:putative transposase
MARLARVILPGYPHHITQRGNRRQEVFFCENDYQYYLELLQVLCYSLVSGLSTTTKYPIHI